MPAASQAFVPITSARHLRTLRPTSSSGGTGGGEGGLHLRTLRLTSSSEGGRGGTSEDIKTHIII